MDEHEIPPNWYIISGQTKGIVIDEHETQPNWYMISSRTIAIGAIIACILFCGPCLGVYALRNVLDTVTAQMQAQQYLSAVSRGDFATALQHCQGAENITQQIAHWGGSEMHDIYFEALERSNPSYGTVRTLTVHFTAHRPQGAPPQQGIIIMSWLFPDLTWWAIPSPTTCSAWE